MVRGISSKVQVDSMAYICSGADANQLTQKMPDLLQTQHNFVLIQGGSNDLNQELRHSIPSMGGLLEATLKSTDKQILVNAIPGHPDNFKHNDLVMRINIFLKHRCSKSERLHLIDCNPMLKASNYMKNSHLLIEEGKDILACQLTARYKLIKV